MRPALQWQVLQDWIDLARSINDSLAHGTDDHDHEAFAVKTSLAISICIGRTKNIEPIQEVLSNIGRSVVTPDAALFDALAIVAGVRDGLENSNEVELTDAQFCGITGMSKGGASKRRKRGEPMTLSAAEAYRDGGHGQKRADADESDEAVERKFRRQ